MPFIPEVGTEFPKELLDEIHPDYSSNLTKYRFLRESEELTGGYKPDLSYEDWLTDGLVRPAHTIPSYTSYLERANGEHIEDYIRRLKAAKPISFVRDGVMMLTGVLTSQTVDRQHYPKALQRALENVSEDSLSWRVYIENSILPLMIRYGWVGVLVLRKPDNSGINLLTVSPENIDHWSEGPDGFEWVRFSTEVDYAPTPFSPYQTEKQYIYITKEGWFTVAEREREQIVIDSGYWLRSGEPLDNCPLVVWELPNRATPSYEAALEQKKFYNTESALDNIEKMTGFPQLMFPLEDMSDKEEIKEIKRGPGYVMFYASGNSTQKPEILSPDKVPFDHFRKELSNIMARAYHAYGITISISDSSGISLAHGQFQAANLYRSMAKACEQGEHRTLKAISELLGIEYSSDMRVDWPTDFGTLSETITIEGVTKYIELQPGIEGSVSAFMKLYSILNPGVTDREKARVEQSTREALRARNGQTTSVKPSSTNPLTNTFGEQTRPANMRGTRDGDGR